MSSSSTVPSVLWVQLLGSSVADRANGVAVGSDGSIYVTGETFGGDFAEGQVFLNSNGDGFISKLNANGVPLWTRFVSTNNQESNNGVSVAADGSVYVVGRTSAGTLDGQISNGGWDCYLIKYSSNGDKLWSRLFGSASSDTANALTIDRDGNVIVAGETNGPFDGQTYNEGKDGFVTKFDAAGNKIWTRFVGSSLYDFICDVAVSQEGNIYLVGSTQGNLDGQVFNGGMDGFITKLSANGTKLWTRLIGGASTDEARGVAVGPEGSIFVTGYTHNNLDGQVNNGTADLFVSKFTSDGIRTWTRLVGSKNGDYGDDVLVSPDGSVLLTGASERGGAEGPDSTVTKFTSSGEFLWSKSYVGNLGYKTSGASLSDGTFLLAGMAKGFSPKTSKNGSEDAFVAKLLVTEGTTAASPTYSISANQSSINEGSTATFTVSTTNVTSGTSLAYTLSGVSASDITGGSLSGTTTVSSNGKATIAVGLVADNQKDGSETLTVTVAGVSASTFVVDSSKPVANGHAPYQNVVYDLVAGGTLSADRELASINATNLSNPWALTGFQSGSDLMHLWRTDNILGGGAIFNPPASSFRSGSGVIAPATPTEYILYDTATGRLYFDQDGTGPSPTTWVATFTDKPTLRATDFQISQPQTYAVAADGGGYNEGATASFTVTTTNVSEGTVLTYTLSGVSASDITGGSLSGTTTVGSNGRATISVPIAADQTTEGNETLTVTVQGTTASTTVVDTSTTTISNPTYTLNANQTSVNEGSSATFLLSTSNVAAGSSVAYTISGISAADIVGGALSGNAVIASNGQATITIPITADATTEGDETLTVTVQGKSAFTVIKDTSLSPPATYQVSPLAASVDEGGIASFSVETTDVTAGTALSYTLSGVTASDVVGGSLTGTTVVGTNGKATISVPIAADLTTEGAETLTLTLQSKSASITINDTSKSTVQLDTVAPLPTSFTPADGALSVSVGSNLAVTFNEPITRGSGTVTLKTAAGSVVETFSATSNRLTVSGSTLTVDPTKNLDIFTRYVLDLGAGAVQDLAGNGSAATSQYDFRTETTDGLYHFFVVAFGAAPGVTYMGQLAEAANFGLSLQEIVEIFTTKSQFTSVYPSSLTNKELAARLVENIVKVSATEVTKQSAAADIEAALGLGWGRGKVIYTVFGNLANKPLSDPTWGGTAKQFQNQLAVARYFTETLEGDSTSVGRLQAVLGNVNKDSDVSSSTKIAQLLNQPAYVVSADKSTFDEGSAVIFTVNSYGVAGGTNLSYALSGTNITGSDLSTGTLAGSVMLDSTGTGFITVQLAEDKSTEGTETLNLLLQGSPVKTVSILDTSRTPVDLTPPTVSSIQITGVDSNNVAKSGALVQGNRVKVVLTMSEATAVIGTPSFTIDVGGSTKTAQYASGSGSNALTFYYAVESGDLDNTGGITALANALALPSGSSIKDSAGNNATLTTAGITTGTNGVSIDAVAPTVRSHSPTPGATNVAIESNFIFTFSEAIKKGTGAILLLDARGSVVESFNVLTSSRLTWTANTLTIDPSSDLSINQLYRFEIPAGAIDDEAGNDYTGTSTYTITTVGEAGPPPGF